VGAFAPVRSAYIVDGHHRVAAAQQVGDPAFLAALVPMDQLRLLPYHRLVYPPLPVPTTELAGVLGAAPAPPDGQLGAPSQPGAALLRAGRRWWRFELDVAEG